MIYPRLLKIKLNRVWNSSYVLHMFLPMILTIAACNGGEEDSLEAKTLSLLTGNEFKQWELHQSFVDDVEQSFTVCDSSYILTMKADYTWSEVFLNIQCYQGTDGVWKLNDQLNVITISYINQATGEEEEKLFEIVELSDEYFSYQFASKNRLRRFRLRYIE